MELLVVMVVVTCALNASKAYMDDKDTFTAILLAVVAVIGAAILKFNHH